MSNKHPAKYTDSFIPLFSKLLEGKNNVLDPFGGTGKLALIKDYGFTGRVICNELEREWVDYSYNVNEWHFGDAAKMIWAKDESFDAICTSPTYGNRMADHHNAKDGSKRITYKHRLGKELSPNNTGMMQWGEQYRETHKNIYSECIRVLKKDGVLILNVSNHIRKKQEVDVVSFHRESIVSLGLSLREEIKMHTPRMGFGRNRNARVENEFILVFTK